MLTSKQRSKLKAMASGISPLGQVGKGGINDNMIKSLGEALECRELIKVNVLKNCDDESDDIGLELAKKLNAECVIAIGNKVVLYRKSSKKDFEHIEI